MNRLKGKTAVVTGAGKGIGRAVVLAFLKEGASVAAISRTRSDLDSLTHEAPRDAGLFAYTGDAADETTIRSFLKESQAQFGFIEGLVNNAGVLTPKGKIPDVEVKEWDETMKVNLRAPFLFMKSLLPAMVQRGNGCIINVSSGVATRAAPLWGPYAVSKSGIDGLTLAAAEEVRSSGVRINTINPGGTRTRMRAAAYPHEDPSTLPSPEEVAEAFVWLFSDEARGVTGQRIDYQDWRSARS